VLAFSINRESFLQGLSRVQSVVERKNTVPILSNVLIDGNGEKLKLMATDMEMGISGYMDANIKSAGAITISARKLFEIIKELPAEAEVTLQVKEDNNSEITCGSTSFKLKGLPAEDFPSLPSYDEETFLTLDAAALREMVRKTIYAASTDETRYNLTGVLFEMEEGEGKNLVRMVATDGHRLALVEKEAKGKIRPGATIDREALISAIRRVSLLSSERSRAVRFTFSDGELIVHTNNPDLGAATETLPIGYDGEDLDVTFNAKYMLDTLTSLDADQINIGLKDELSPCRVYQEEDQDYIAVIMPMRV